MGAFEGVAAGSVLLPPDEPRDDVVTAEPWTHWRYRASWETDVVAFWFGLSGDQELQMFELGMHMGRYCSGSGVKRVIIGMNPGCPLKAEVQGMIDAANFNLQGPWKFELIDDLDRFLAKIKAAVSPKK
jgi:hypothetical protein